MTPGEKRNLDHMLAHVDKHDACKSLTAGQRKALADDLRLRDNQQYVNEGWAPLYPTDVIRFWINELTSAPEMFRVAPDIHVTLAFKVAEREKVTGQRIAAEDRIELFRDIQAMSDDDRLALVAPDFKPEPADLSAETQPEKQPMTKTFDAMTDSERRAKAALVFGKPEHAVLAGDLVRLRDAMATPVVIKGETRRGRETKMTLSADSAREAALLAERAKTRKLSPEEAMTAYRLAQGKA